ncbi:MAG: xanthine dehydrogenase family protein molybdopterin-binding subunit [Jatrophihabitans sp.]|nr:xanthine dehydrogenase family protein molybdopterin-binding subunit [Jatrophihabitans sp.]
MTALTPHAIGTPQPRIEAEDKVTGRAAYAYEHQVDEMTYGWIVGSTVAAGTVRDIDITAALREPGVLDVVWHGNAMPLHKVVDTELHVLQGPEIAYYGQPIAVVVATSLEAARAGARALDVNLQESHHESELRRDDPNLFTPESLNAGFPSDTSAGDVEKALAGAAFSIDEVYETPPLHNVPMEPHAAIARWEDDGSLTLWDTTQNSSEVADTVAQVFGLDAGQVVVHSEHVGGGFGSKGTTRPNAVLAALAARVVGWPVKIALTREMTFHFVGYRTPTQQRVRLGADPDGRLVAIAHDTIELTSKLLDFAEQTGESTRHVYAADNRQVTHLLTRLNVPTPRWLRAPGEAPGVYAVEAALDELARAIGMDPVELRIRNEPATDPGSGKAFSSRGYVNCLREGAERFGWGTAFDRRVGPWRVGQGMAGSIYPAYLRPSTARAEVHHDGTYDVSTAAADIGTGARTVLRQIAADALGVPIDNVRMHVGHSSLPQASVAGGSSGTASWGSAVTKACRLLREQLGRADHIPPGGLSATADTSDDVARRADLARFAFGAQFVEVRVHEDTGEVRVPRALGVFAVGRVINARLGRSQLIGGMTMGLGMGLMEEGVMDHTYGDTMNDDYAGYHIAANADIGDIEVSWLDEKDDQLNPMGSKGIGEIGIVGTAAAVTNAVYDAVGVRVRDLPVRLDKLLPHLST